MTETCWKGADAKFCYVPWDINGSNAEWKARLEKINELVNSACASARGEPDRKEVFEYFYRHQLAVLIIDMNKMEGIIHPSVRQEDIFTSIKRFLEEPETEPPAVFWNAEGSREVDTISTRRQLYQCTKAAVHLLEKNLREPLSLSLILETYRIMMENSYMEDKRGNQTLLPVTDTRDCDVFAGYYCFAPAQHVKGCLAALCNYYNHDTGSIHPVSRATYLFYELITVHPFLNGNGRLCRLFLAWSLMRDGLPFPVSFSTGHKKRRQHYLHAIETARVEPTGHRGELNAIVVVSLERILGKYYDLKRHVKNAHSVDSGDSYISGTSE